MYDTLASSAEVVAGVLGIAVTVVAIIVELAANRYNHRITTMFIGDPVNIGTLSFFVVTAIACLWVSALSSADGDPLLHWTVMGMITLSLLGLLPYFFYVFTFISPLAVIRRIRQKAKRAINACRRRYARKRRIEVARTIDELMDVIRSVVSHGDRDIAMAAISALEELLKTYRGVRHEMPAEWFPMDFDIRRDPDYISLEQPAIDEIDHNRHWLEYKIFKQYQSTMVLCVGEMRELANLIGICTRRIAVEFGSNDPALMELSIRAMNSYLRIAINARELRTSYYLLSQYRMIAEQLLEWRRPAEVEEIARWFKTYGELARTSGQTFLQEVCAFDLVQLLERAWEREQQAVDELLSCLLQLDREASTEEQVSSLLGVRRAQIRAAAFLLEVGDKARARRVMDDLKGEDFARIARLVYSLRQENRSQFWELTPRGVNFFYMRPELRVHLDAILTGVQ